VLPAETYYTKRGKTTCQISAANLALWALLVRDASSVDLDHPGPARFARQASQSGKSDDFRLRRGFLIDQALM
jgi:hypothetical protein